VLRWARLEIVLRGSWLRISNCGMISWKVLNDLLALDRLNRISLKKGLQCDRVLAVQRVLVAEC